MRRQNVHCRLTLSLASLCALLLVCLFHAPPEGARAYLTGRDGAENVFTTGENTSEVVEQFSQSSLTAGTNIFEKRVAVKNTGNIPCYVRVFLAFSDSSICGLSELSADGKNFYKEEAFQDHPGKGWTYGGDGYYYYASALQPGETTAELLQKVTTTFPEGAKIRDFEIIVYEESIQARDGSGALFPEGITCQQAFSDFVPQGSSVQEGGYSAAPAASNDQTGNGS